MTRTRPQRLPGAIWALGGVSLLMDVSSEMIHGLLPVFLVTTLGASPLLLGAIEGVAEATALVVKVFSGVLSDWWGRRKSLTVAGYSLSALAKPLFALATGIGAVWLARLVDRIGKGIRGAPRDALVAELAPPEQRGAAFGLRQSLDTVGAVLGPLVAIVLLSWWTDDLRSVFWVAAVPAIAAVVLLQCAVHEPPRAPAAPRGNPIRREQLRRLPAAYWGTVAIGAAVMLARFSEAFLVLRAEQGGLPIAWAPLVLIVLNVVYALGAWPFGRLSDRASHAGLLARSLVVLLLAHTALAIGGGAPWLWIGLVLWGLHLAIAQGLLTRLVADTAPKELLGTAYGVFHLVGGLALLAASVLAGGLWHFVGAPATFAAGAAFAALALVLLFVLRRRGFS
jgi:MFS family permease